MARQARVNAEFQHVIVRGIGKQILFEDDSDRLYYLSLLKRYRDETGIAVLAYCLMENHVHLLLRDSIGKTVTFMKKMGISYAGYYNKKYDRTGHLFQDRYRSETITDDSYLLAAYRYILKNPEKAGISEAKDYRWSSYKDYGKKEALTDTSLQMSLLGTPSEFRKYLMKEDKTEFLEDTEPKKDDEWALDTIRKTLHVDSGTALQQMTRQHRDEALTELRKKGLSVRQLERLTGINRGIIQNAK